MKSATRVQWSFKCSEGISFPFDGIPFICVGTVNYQCHQGNDVDLKTKQKRQDEQDRKEVVQKIHYFYTYILLYLYTVFIA